MNLKLMRLRNCFHSIFSEPKRQYRDMLCWTILFTFIFLQGCGYALKRQLTAPAQRSEVEQAVIDAKRDAGQNTSLVIPFLVGAAASGLSVAGLYYGAQIASEIPSPPGEHILPSAAQMCALFGPGLIGYLIPHMGLTFAKNSPPPELLLGKSPVYVRAYTRAYKQRVSLIRSVSAGAGSFLGCIIIPIVGNWLEKD